MKKLSEQLNLDNTVVNPQNRMTFAAWMDALDSVVGSRFSLSVMDLADFASWDVWNSGSSVREGFLILCEAQDDNPLRYFVD